MGLGTEREQRILSAIVAEIEAFDCQSADPHGWTDRDWLRYLLEGAAEEVRLPEGMPSDVMDRGHAGLRLDDFVAHPSARQSLLTKAHVVALRLYTTAAFRSINDPLRDRDRYDNKLPHKLPVTVALLRDALGKLRAVEANQCSKDGGADKGGFASPRVSPRELHLYRGMKDVTAPASFMQQGGTELAPISTTSNLSVAMKYSASVNAVLLRLITESFYERGPDISFLSAFPGEAEFLFPPLTYLQPTGDVETVVVEGLAYEVVDVRPRI